MKIIALDPGGTTGWATYDSRGDGPFGGRWTCGQIGPQEHHEELMIQLETEQTHDYYVVCESFEFRQGKQRAGINLMSKEYIGLVKYFGAVNPSVPVVFQTAALGKGFVSDDKLKVMDLYFPGKRHANDALRHLVTFMVQKKHRKDLIEPWRKLV